MSRVIAICFALVAMCAQPSLAAEKIDWTTLPAMIDGPGGEAWLTRHPNGKVIVFGRHDANYQNHRLFMTRWVNGKWTEPTQLPFTKDLSGTAPHFAPNGRSLLFLSTRLPTGEASTAKDPEANIWRVSWNGKTWGKPRQLPLNSPNNEIDAIEVNSGTIYFSSMPISDGKGPKPDLYKAVPTKTGYRVEPLAQFNTDHTESTLYVTPDESLIIFHRDGDPVGVGKDDLFAAKRQGAGWGPIMHLKGVSNSPGFDYGPELSRDGSTIYFTTHRSGEGKIMTVSLKEAMGN